MPVSVIIPTYNRSAMVVEALRSAVAQSAPAHEVIVVDDGSNDDTLAVLQRESAKDVHLIRRANRGVAAARNLGVARSSGDLIAFLDSDDLWLPDKLATQTAFFATHPEAMICQTEEVWIRNGVRVNPRTYHHKPSGDVFDASLERCLVSPSAVMMRRALFEEIGGFDESLPACEDYDLWLRIARSTLIWRLDAALVIKRGGHADQLSRRHWGMDRFRVATLVRLLCEGGLSETQSNAVGRVLRDKCRILANGASKRGRDEEAERYSSLARWTGQQLVRAAEGASVTVAA
ncbi:MAG: glycosyltransferase [Deltaproteobacteria bacterium]|nr:glycosyltransferase [Deltaproteobacteria bacterium]